MALLLLWACLARAQTSVIIVVPHVSTSDYEPYEHRLRSELIAEGFQPISVEVLAVTSQTLQKHATRLMSPAAISISVHDGVVSGMVWIRGRAASPDLMRSIPDYPLSAQTPSIFAVRATDVLHGGLLELGYIGTTVEPTTENQPNTSRFVENEPGLEAKGSKVPRASSAANDASSAAGTAVQAQTTEQPSAATTSAAPANRSKREKPPKAWFFRGMANVGLPMLAYSTNYGFNPSVMRRVSPHFNVGFSGGMFLPLVARTRDGHANIAQAYVGPRLESVQQLAKQLTLFEFVEIGGHAIFVTSDTVVPNRAHSAQSFTGYSSLGAGATWALNGTVGLMAGTGLLLPWKRADVIVVRTVVAEAAGPALLFNAGIQLAF